MNLHSRLLAMFCELPISRLWQNSTLRTMNLVNKDNFKAQRMQNKASLYSIMVKTLSVLLDFSYYLHNLGEISPFIHFQ